MLLLAAAVCPPSLSAQRVRGEVMYPDSTSAASQVIVIAADANGVDVAQTTSGQSGAFDLQLPRSGQYRIRALRLGFRPTRVAPVDVAADQTRSIRIILSPSIVSLAQVRVRGQSVCGVRADSGQLVADLWQQARFALLSTALAPAEQQLVWSATSYERTLDPSGSVVRAESVTVVRGARARPFGSVPVDALADAGYVIEDKTGVTYRAPDAEVLLSESFAAGHCFTAVPPPLAHPEWVGLNVTPARARARLSDIDGVLWIDRATAELRLFEYRYTGIPEEGVKAGAGGRVEFVRMSTGQWIVNRFEIRMPSYVLTRSLEGVDSWALRVTRTSVREIRLKGGEGIEVGDRAGNMLYQSTEGTLDAFLIAPDSESSGAAAQLELADTRYATVADSTGRARLEHVRPGRYMARILSPAMYRAGVAPSERVLDVAADAPVTTVRIVLPSGGDLRRAVCGDSIAAERGALLYGVVADSLRRSLRAMRFAVNWTRASAASKGTPAPRASTEEHELAFDEIGRWRLCGVPTDRALSLVARAIGFEEAGFSVRLSPGRASVEVSLPDSVVRTMLSAEEVNASNRATVLRGRVTQFGDTALAVVGAGVELIGTGAKGVTNDEGRFKFYGSVLPGSYDLRIRRIGYLPLILRVVLDAGRPVEQNVMLHRPPNTLRAVRIQGRKVDVPAGFEDVYARAARGFADFITREEIERRGVTETSSLLFMIPGVHVFPDSISFARCMKSPLDGRPAKVQVYLDGVRLTRGASDKEIVNVLHEIPAFTIQAMEVYRGVSRIPGEFLDDACAVIAIWTKQGR